MKKKSDEHKNKETWGHVEPGPLSDGEAAALRPLQENAAKSGNVKATDMDPQPSEGEEIKHSEEHREHKWQKLSPEEQKKFKDRKDGYPKNLS